MQHRFSRTEMLIGKEGQQKLNESFVAVFGIGGVGSFTAEALARSSVGNIMLVDFDEVCITNINRQLHATTKTVGKKKVEVMAERLKQINPKINIKSFASFYSPEDREKFFDQKLDYVVDAIDTVSGKLDLVEQSFKRNIPIISAMGAGNKLRPELLEIEDISKTSICPLARVMRKELKRRGIYKGLDVVYSKEKPLKPQIMADCKNNCVCPGGDGHCTKKRQIPGSVSFVPSVAGLLMAGRVVNNLLR
ncbi:tRNA threonylcarbamoyladenosine dehydratase [Proteinivorax hydrogeniformans]|uniref:tRNA threonylcarbamoyladenosine dehydratase n=1 Tax=Proteinivorax hydrogeniformans TaxID=1826727 RepID=A0AAU8HR54_9FIRM